MCIRDSRDCVNKTNEKLNWSIFDKEKFIFDDSSATVSYTHLLGNFGLSLEGILSYLFAPLGYLMGLEGGNVLKAGELPVSYTHLDVYKRQVADLPDDMVRLLDKCEKI